MYEAKVHIVNGSKYGHMFMELTSPGRSVFYELTINENFSGPSIGGFQPWYLQGNPYNKTDGIYRKIQDFSRLTVDADDVVSSKAIPLSGDAFSRIVTFAEYALNGKDVNTTDYMLWRNSCVTFVDEALKFGGVKDSLSSLFTADDVKKIASVWLWDHPLLSDVPRPPGYVPAWRNFLNECFCSGTLILMDGGKEKRIEDVQVGDCVWTVGRASSITVGSVGKLYRNVTTEWLILRAADGSRERLVELTVTPGHYFRRPDGSFMRIDEILALDGLVVWRDGTVLKVVAERIVYSAETAHLYEQAEKVVYPTQGGLALQPEVVRGWRTYNFEVLEHHNYIAGGVQVHNDSSPTLAIAAADFHDAFGFDFDGSNKGHLDLMMGAIADGDIKAYGDYVGNLSDDRYTATFYDAARDKIVATFGETETIFTTVRDGRRETGRRKWLGSLAFAEMVRPRFRFARVSCNR